MIVQTRSGWAEIRAVEQASGKDALGQLLGENELKPGDLLFYTSHPDRQVTHVALFTGSGQVLDATINLGLVKRPVQSLLDLRALVRLVRISR